MMDIRKKHIYFTVCSLSVVYAVIITFAFVGKKDATNEVTSVTCDHKCTDCCRDSRIVRLQQRLLTQKSITYECALRLLKLQSPESDAHFGSDLENEAEEKLVFHEYLLQQLLANGNDEKRKSTNATTALRLYPILAFRS